MRWLGVLLLAIGSLGAVHPSYANETCEPDTGIRLSGPADAPWTVQIQVNPKTIPLNAPFDATVTICSRSEHLPTRLGVDATMPAHKHGMNYKVEAAPVADRTYVVKNLLFHMPGVWRLEVTAFEKNKPHRFTHDVELQ